MDIHELTEGTPVRIYWNLHSYRYSVQAKVDGRWKVVGHVDQFDLTDVEFKVSQAGRERVLREKRKNVHAFVHGKWSWGTLESGIIARVSYNPYKADTFIRHYMGAEAPVRRAPVVLGRIDWWNHTPKMWAINA